MNICSHCLCDFDVSPQIESNELKGVCDFCGKFGSVLSSTSSALADAFSDFLSHFVPTDANDSHGFYFADFVRRCHIFSDTCENMKINVFMSELAEQSGVWPKELFSGKIDFSSGTKLSLSPGHDLILKNTNWIDFSEQIKQRNRFFPSGFDETAFRSIVRELTSKISYHVFYRTRIWPSIHPPKGKDLNPPPLSKMKEGRIAARGLYCLYASNTISTSILESRALRNDTVAVGQIIIKNASFLDLRRLSRRSFLFTPNPRVLDLNLCTLQEIQKQLEKPVTSSDDPLEYVPSQFICDAVRAIPNIDGILYQSTLGTGYDIALFNKRKFAHGTVFLYTLTDCSLKRVKK